MRRVRSAPGRLETMCHGKEDALSKTPPRAVNLIRASDQRPDCGTGRKSNIQAVKSALVDQSSYGVDYIIRSGVEFPGDDVVPVITYALINTITADEEYDLRTAVWHTALKGIVAVLWHILTQFAVSRFAHSEVCNGLVNDQAVHVITGGGAG